MGNVNTKKSLIVYFSYGENSELPQDVDASASASIQKWNDRGAVRGSGAAHGDDAVVRPRDTHDGGGGDRHAEGHYRPRHRGRGGDHRRHGDGHPAGGLSGGGGAGHTGAAGDRQAVPGADELRPAGERPRCRRSGGDTGEIRRGLPVRQLSGADGGGHQRHYPRAAVSVPPAGAGCVPAAVGGRPAWRAPHTQRAVSGDKPGSITADKDIRFTAVHGASGAGRERGKRIVVGY